MKSITSLLPALLLIPSAAAAAAVALPPPVQLPLPLIPPSANMPSDQDATTQVQRSVSLADILGTQRSVTTFFSFARQTEDITRLLSDPGINSTDPRDYATYGEQAYDGSGGKSRADENVRRFVEAHLVGTSPWEEGVKVKAVGGRQIWWESKKHGDRERRVIMPDEVEVERVASQVANGELWILKGVLNYAP
ncbi:FAS1 domain-containing protein [Cladobotryum mycophilum]|uniref:FAS1 domain-containing protein n=1 Tax=Cladobotryum mycophilum TaxID=491253 RepID=A0ABR0SL87_9HYPO